MSDTPESWDTSLNIHQRLLRVMAEAGHLVKAGTAPDKIGGYKFVKHDDVANMVRPLCTQHGVLVSTTVDHWDAEANTTTCTLAISFINVDDPEDALTVKTFGFGIDGGDKGPGKAMSYAKKYGLIMQFLLATGDDHENDASENKRSRAGSKKSEPKNEAPASVQEQCRQVVVANVSEEAFTAYMNANYPGKLFQKLTADEAKEVAKWSGAQKWLQALIKSNAGVVTKIISIMAEHGHEVTDLDLMNADQVRVVKMVLEAEKAGKNA